MAEPENHSQASDQRFDFEVLQHASALAVRRIRRESIPAVTILIHEGSEIERRSGRWPTARRAILVARVCGLGGCIEQLACLERLLREQFPSHSNTAKILQILRETENECRRIEEAALEMLVHIQI